MKLVTFDVQLGLGLPPNPRVGLLLGDQVADLHACTEQRLAWSLPESEARIVADYLAPDDMLGFLRRGEEALTAACETLNLLLSASRSFSEGSIWPRSEVKLLAPLPRPNTIRDFIAFEQHMKTAAERIGQSVHPLWYELPVYYKGNPGTVIGPEEDIIWPSFTEKLDYELELGMIIGKRGKDIPESEAHTYIAGYTIFNDVSARDIQAREMALLLGPGKGKDFDTSNVIGPCIVTPDEFDPATARMTARVNGEVWSEGVAGSMYHPFPKLIARASLSETLQPGDFFGSGTVGGGCGLELDRWIKPGDVIELEVEGIGVLRNRVVRP
jgi:2-keto-4-pentenoate hydratase/2-oxohepta-3-ene-1,7-dioic acid hydratase in catechol pathway